MTAMQSWPGVASFSKSVFSTKEPRNTKPVFRSVQRYALGLLTRQRDEVRFIQVGANDGVSGDPLNEFIVGGRWSGLLVEPVEAAHQKLLKIYSAFPGLMFCRNPVWSRSERRSFYVVDGADVLSSFSLDTILLHEPKYENLKGMIREIEVDAYTLDDLADRFGIADPDVVAVDAEGCDDVVLASFNLESARPSIVMFEHVALSAAASAALKARLEGIGYALIFDRHDVLAILEGSFDASLTAFLRDVVSQAREN